MLASDIDPWVWRASAFVFGAVWGSFFNVAIYRWPRDMSVVSPPSHCPACGKPIAAARNVPIFGWLVLRGKAECCGARISVRYPIVELASALLCVALVERFAVHAADDAPLAGSAIEAVVYFAFAGGLLIASFVDLEFMEIPDEVSLPLGALGLVTVGMRQEPGALDAALGAGGGFLLVQLIFVWAYERLVGRRGMGEGDAKLLFMIGAFLGWQGALVSLVLGAFQGLAVAVVMIATGRRITPVAADARSAHDEDEEDEDDEEDEEASAQGAGAAGDQDGAAGRAGQAGPIGQVKVPYGPFLALGALEFLFFGNVLLERYMSLFQ